jgi:hypothetical protein
MRKSLICLFIFCILAVFFTGPVSAYSVYVSHQIPAGNAYIPQGTLIEAELITGVNSQDNGVNDIAYFKLRQNVIINGVVVLPAGTVGNATVTAAKPAKFLGRKGGIELKITSIQALNGAVVPLSLDLKKSADTPDHYIPYLLLGLYDLGYKKLSMYAAAIHGEDQEIPAGTKFQVVVDADADLGCTPDRLAVVMIKTR